MKWPETENGLEYSYLILKLTHEFRKQSPFSTIGQSRSFWRQITKITGEPGGGGGWGLSNHTTYRLNKSYAFIWIPHSKTPISGIILLFFRIQVPLCHSITDQHQTALTTLSMQIYQQRLVGSLPETWQQPTEGGHQHGHQSSKHSLGTH